MTDPNREFAKALFAGHGKPLTPPSAEPERDPAAPPRAPAQGNVLGLPAPDANTEFVRELFNRD